MWPSAVAAATEIARQPELVRGKRVVELGCGLGLPGIVAGLSGAKHVLLTDQATTALRLALTSAGLNGLRVRTGEVAALKGSRLFPHKVSAQVMLDDAREKEGSGDLPLPLPVRTSCTRWGTPSALRYRGGFLAKSPPDSRAEPVSSRPPTLTVCYWGVGRGAGVEFEAIEEVDGALSQVGALASACATG